MTLQEAHRMIAKDRKAARKADVAARLALKKRSLSVKRAKAIALPAWIKVGWIDHEDTVHLATERNGLSFTVTSYEGKRPRSDRVEVDQVVSHWPVDPPDFDHFNAR